MVLHNPKVKTSFKAIDARLKSRTVLASKKHVVRLSSGGGKTCLAAFLRAFGSDLYREICSRVHGKGELENEVTSLRR
jgi:hypothetical protein